MGVDQMLIKIDRHKRKFKFVRPYYWKITIIDPQRPKSKSGVKSMKQRSSKQERRMDLLLTILTVIVFVIAIYYEVQYFR